MLPTTENVSTATTVVIVQGAGGKILVNDKRLVGLSLVGLINIPLNHQGVLVR